MTILNVEQAWSRTNGSVTSSNNGKTLSAKFSDGWQVMHTKDTTEADILLATGLPKIYDYKAGTFVPCTGLSIEQRGLIYSLVKVDYDKTIQIDPSNPNVNWSQSPLNAPPEIEWSDETSTENIDQDADGNPITTVNGEAINGVTIELPDPVLTVTRNFATWNPHIIHQYRMSTNSDTFQSFAPGTARLVSAPAKLVIDQQFGSYWRVTARIRFRYPYNTTAAQAWYARVRHEGFRVKEGTDIKHATDDEGNKVVTPVLLKTDGTIETDKDNAVWLTFKRYFPLPYSNLGFL
jgi:hypothetical protein